MSVRDQTSRPKGTGCLECALKWGSRAWRLAMPLRMPHCVQSADVKRCSILLQAALCCSALLCAVLCCSAAPCQSAVRRPMHGWVGPRPQGTPTPVFLCPIVLPGLQIIAIQGGAGAVFSIGLLNRLDMTLFDRCINYNTSDIGGPTHATGAARVVLAALPAGWHAAGVLPVAGAGGRGHCVWSQRGCDTLRCVALLLIHLRAGSESASPACPATIVTIHLRSVCRTSAAGGDNLLTMCMWQNGFSVTDPGRELQKRGEFVFDRLTGHKGFVSCAGCGIGS